ncbi:MAG: phage tail protein [Acetobacter papayae]
MTVVQVNEIDVVVNDRTAEGAASAGVHLDEVQDKAFAARDALKDMGSAGDQAAQTVAGGARDAAAATDNMAASATASLSAMRKAYSALKAEAASLQTQLDKVGASGGDTGNITAELSRTQTEMARLQDSMASMRQKTAAATDAQLAWNGQLNAANAPIIGLAKAMAQTSGAADGLGNVLRAGVNTDLKSLYQMGASAGDTISRLTLRLQTAQDRLQQVKVQSLSAVASGMPDQDAQRIVAAQQAVVDTLTEQIAVAREASAAMDGLTSAHIRSTNAAKLEGYQVGILMDEAHKFFDMVLAGGNPLQAAFYEVPNAVQVMGGFGATLQRVTGFLSGPGGIAVAAAAAGAAIYKVGAYAEGEQEQLAQLSQHLRATRTDYAEMATQAEEAARALTHSAGSNLSLDDSRTVVQTLVAVPTVDTSQLDRLTTEARNLSAVMGTTVPEAAKTMAAAIHDPAQAAQSFSQSGMPGFNAGLVLMVQHMQQAGNEAGALRLLMDTLDHTVQGAADQGLTKFQQAYRTLSHDMAGSEDVLREYVRGAGDLFTQMGTTALQVVDDIIHGVEKIPAAIGSIGTSLLGVVQSAGSWIEGGVESGLNAVGTTNMASLMHQGSTASPTFSAPATGATSAAASAASAVAAAQDKQRVATTSATAALAEQRKSIDALVGSDDSWSGRITDQRRKIEGLETGISKLKAMGAQGYGTGYSAALQNLTGQLQAAQVSLAGMRGPFADLIEQQDRAAQSASALTGYDKAMVSAAQQADDAARSLSGGMASAAEKSLVQAAAARTLSAEYQTNLSVINRNIGLQDQITAAWEKGGSAASHATNYVEAYNYVLDHFGATSANFGQKVDAMAASLDRLSASRAATQLAQQTSANNDQLAVLQAQTATLGQNDEARQRLISHMQAEQQLERDGRSLTDASAQAYLKSADAVADASIAYQHQQQVLDDVTGSLSNMADQLSDGITQGFLQGTSSGMSFKSTLQGVETQIISMLARMALINPLLNAIDGKSRTTLSDISSLFGGTGESGGSSGGETLDAVSSSGWAISPGEALAMKNQISGSSSSSSASGQGWLGSLIGTKIGGSNVSIGSIAGGIAGGMSLGSALSSVGGGSDGTWGALAGTAVGTGLGAFFGGPIGAVIGGTVLGGLGGLIGSLFSQTHYAWDTVSAQNGHLGISGTRTYKAGDDVTGQLNPQLSAVNKFLDLNDVYFDDGTLGDVGHYHKGKTSYSRNLSDIITNGTLDSDDANLKQALKDLMPTSVSDISTWQQDVTSIKSISDAMDTMKVSIKSFDDSTHVTVDHFNGYTGDMATALSTLDGKTLTDSDLQSQFQAIQEFVGTTMPGLLRVTAAGSESLMDQVDALKQKYQSAADTAKSYGLDAQALLDTGNAIAAKMIADQNTSLAQSDLSVQARYMAATGNQEGADLLNQQVSGDQAIAQLQESWRGYLGDTYAQNVTYQQQMADLDKTLAAERLEIQQQYAGNSLAQLQQYNSSALQSVTSVFSSLNGYVQDLATSDASPLSIQAQYGVSNANLTSDYQAAMGGDYDALSRVQSDAQTYLTLAKQWDGSGTAYADDFQRVLTMLQSIGSLGSDTFTASLAKTLFQQNTDATLQVKTAIQSMQTAITAELRQFTRVQAAKAA